MKLVLLLCTGLWLGLVGSFAEAGWTQWPSGREDYEPSVQIPPGFARIPAAVRDADRYFLNTRLKSKDGTVEFAVTAMNVRRFEKSIKARTIVLPLAAGERIVDRKPAKKTVKGEAGEYVLYDEDITVAGPKGAYMRYFRLELSTGTLPGASSILWEFKAASDKARKLHAAAYRKFKERVNLGED